MIFELLGIWEDKKVSKKGLGGLVKKTKSKLKSLYKRKSLSKEDISKKINENKEKIKKDNLEIKKIKSNKELSPSEKRKRTIARKKIKLERERELERLLILERKVLNAYKRTPKILRGKDSEIHALPKGKRHSKPYADITRVYKKKDGTLAISTYRRKNWNYNRNGKKTYYEYRENRSDENLVL